jgi:ribosomal protein L40E
MSNRPGRNGKALSLLIVWSIALGGIFAAIVALGPATRAGACDQIGINPIGDWTITTAQVCSGILYTVDGTITINSPGSLTLINGGLKFSKDASHMGSSLNVNAGGALILDNSIVTTNPTAINPYLKLALTVSGAGSQLVMSNGAKLKFPGWFNATGAALNMTDSTITGFNDSEIQNTGLDLELNDDGPVMAWTGSTTASLYRTRLDRIYQDSRFAEGGRAGGANFNLTVSGSSTLYAYDSYINVDYSNIVGTHNELHVDGTSAAYLYNVTIDRTQDPIYSSNWTAAYVPTAAGGSVNLFRWLDAKVLDRTSFAVAGTAIWSSSSPTGVTAQYPDNGPSPIPSGRTLWYLGRSSGGANAWNRTDSNGRAKIPLYTDQITSATLPNGQSFGNFRVVLSYSTSTVTDGVSFNAYPAVSVADNTHWATYSFPNVQVRTGPDLEMRQADYTSTLNVIQSQPFVVYAKVYNRGQTDASGVSIAAFLNGNRASQLARVNGLTIATGGSVNQSLNVAAINALGAQTLMLVADPDNVINEGGSAQESNNFANITLNVAPPPPGYVAIVTPAASQSVEPGKEVVVTGYVRATGTDAAIVGISLTIELRSSTAIMATNASTSGEAGLFVGTIIVPAGIQDGSYDVVVTPTATSIQPQTQAIAIRKNVPFLNQTVPILGLPYWLFFIILAAAAAAVIGVTLYWKIYGLGKMVECGECGAFIPEDATSCPKCGVEFEKDMAKCSNCQAWIPIDVKQCPECGVEFATGQVEMADYQEKMRLQYDEVVTKFKEEASRQLGRALSDREFQEWWRKQPTFVTFEDWLREEEEMRKMGSKPCPTCGTLNSVTATVCHKCGSLMRDAPRPPSGGGSGGAAPVIQTRRPGGSPPPESPSGSQASPYGPPSAQPGAPSGTEGIPRRVIRKPIAPQPVVQKKVIKKPSGEGGDDEGQSNSGSENTTDDEL